MQADPSSSERLGKPFPHPVAQQIPLVFSSKSTKNPTPHSARTRVRAPPSFTWTVVVAPNWPPAMVLASL